MKPKAFTRIASVFVLSMVLGTQSEDRFTLESPNGIKFSEFKGYDTWPLIAPSQPDDGGGCGATPAGCIKAIVGNPAMVKAYSEGIPANGKAVPDGAMMAKIEWAKKITSKTPYGATVPGPLQLVSFMLKDSKRFPDTAGSDLSANERQPQSDTGVLLQRQVPAPADGLFARRHWKTARRSLHIRSRYFDGFVFPTRRRVLIHDSNGVANHESAPITIDLPSVTIERE
jgi:hypothetical protein